MQIVTDEALMTAVRDGDLAKLGLLFTRYHVALFDFLSRMTGDRTAAEDLVQDIFVRILKLPRDLPRRWPLRNMALPDRAERPRGLLPDPAAPGAACRQGAGAAGAGFWTHASASEGELWIDSARALRE
jgi:hypothetical protein